MKKFKNYFILTFKDKYIDYCKSIQQNIISAYYNIEFLKSIKPYTARNKVCEPYSYKLIEHIVQIFWQDLILSVTRVIEKKNKNNKSLRALYKEFYNYRIDDKTYKDLMQSLNKISLPKATEDVVLKSRKNLFAHSLFYDDKIFIKVEEIEKLLAIVVKRFNEEQFQINNIKSFSIKKNHLRIISNNCKQGIIGLFKPTYCHIIKENNK